MPGTPTKRGRVPSLWFEDGTIVIQAGLCLYRVYSGVLSAKSPIFKDMFSMPQPLSLHEETVDGCPVVHLQDMASDATAFFSALFDTESEFFLEPPHKVPYDVVAGVLRLSTKYDVPYLRRRAITHFSTVFPLLPASEDISNRKEKQETVLMTRSSYLLSINLARECRTLWMLPFAFYHSCLEYAFGIWKGEHIVEAFLSAEDERLTAISVLKLCRAKSQLIFQFLGRGCKSNICIQARMVSAQKCMEPTLPDPHILDLDIDWAHFNSQACQKCIRDEELRRHSDLLAQFDKLPGYFGLPNWDRLRELEQHDLDY